jgi:hypothetical protein
MEDKDKNWSPVRKVWLETLEKRVETLEKKLQDLIDNLRIFMRIDKEEHGK